LTVFALDLYLCGPSATEGHGLRNWTAFLSASGSWRIVLDLTLIGLFSGFYVVPLFAFVQSRTPRDRLSRVIAGNNILNALFIVTASLFGLLLDRLGFNVPQVFLMAAVLNVVVAVYIFTLVPEFLMRFITWVAVNTLYRIRVDGMQNLPEEGPALLVCNHVSFMDPLILMANLRRPARFVMYYKIFRIPVLHFVFKTAKAIPIAGQKEDPAVLHQAFEDVDAALARGELVCIFPEGGLTKDGNISLFRPGVEKILERRPVPVVPMALRGLWGSVWSRRDSMMGRARLPRRFRARVELVVDAPRPASQVDAGVLQDRVQVLRGDMA
jgi:1-acyl-sn-glycerol-3-phosphate acyltransferase